MKFFGFLFVLVLVVGGVGLALDWWSFTTETQAGETEVSFKINKDKIEADTKAATAKIKEKTKDLVDKVKQAGGDAVVGTIDTVDGKNITVRKEDGSVSTFKVNSETKIELNDAAGTLLDLTAGDSVTVVDEKKDGKADKIVVVR